MLKSGEFNKIVITRPVVPVEEDIGFLPGNIVKKMDPWTRPIMDIFMEHYSKTEIDNMIFNNVIEISPLAYMRGRTFKNAFIIADEMQNRMMLQMGGYSVFNSQSFHRLNNGGIVSFSTT